MSADRRRKPWRPRQELLQSASSLDSPVLLFDFQPELVVGCFRNCLLQLKIKLLFQSCDRELKRAGAADELDIADPPRARVARRIEHHLVLAERQSPLRALHETELLHGERQA